MPEYEVKLVMTAPDLSLAVGRIVYDIAGQPNEWLVSIEVKGAD